MDRHEKWHGTCKKSSAIREFVCQHHGSSADPNARAGHSMERITGYIGAMVVSAIGWQIGRASGFMMSFMLSVIGAGVGLYLTRRFLSSFFES